MTLKYTEVKNHVESFKYILLSDTYSTNREKLRYKCLVGHEFDWIGRSTKTIVYCQSIILFHVEKIND